MEHDGQNHRLETSVRSTRRRSGCCDSDGHQHLEDEAAVMLLAALRPGEQGRPGSILEDFAYTFTSLSRTLEIVSGPDLLRYGHTLNKHQTD